MKKKIIIFTLLLIILPISKVKAYDFSYQTHIQNIGWQDYVENNEISGTTGKAYRLEAIKINLDNSGSITYQTHVQNKGWLPWVENGEISGTSGQALRMEAIKIELTDELKEHYNIFYRVHVQNKGWLSWVKDGEMAGTIGQALRMEAIQIKLVNKQDMNIQMSYSVHNANGWLNDVQNGEMAGTTGQALKIDSLKINLENFSSYDGGIEYSTYLTPYGWSKINSSNEVSGENGKTIEAVKINLIGELAEKFNVYYRVHVQNFGWLDWTANGNVAGTIGYFYRIEAIEIKIEDKDITTTSIGSRPFVESINEINYSSHVESIGWQNYVNDNNISGTTGQTKRLEAFKIKLNTKITGSINYNSYVTKRGWSSYVSDDSIAGTTGLARTIEGISIKLSGEISNYYDVYYRTHMSNIGWLSWAKNGEKAGAIDSGSKLEAIQIKLVKKGLPFNEDTKKSFVTGTWRDGKYYDYFGRMATGFKLIDGVKYYFNSEGKLYGKNVQKVIDVSSWQESINWDLIKRLEDVDAAIIRVGWGTSYNDPCGTDSYLDRNIKEVQRLNIPYGIYIYAYAETTAAAKKEANFVISKMKQYNMPKNTYVWYSGVRQLDTTNGNTNTTKIRSYPIWVSQYYKDLQYTGTYKGWQYASDERVDGISGNVDVSMFKK